ncbi:MAG: DUF927 domain-containing protein [Ruminiclostridium sp.]|nr:DUF927 domain-containing protein [Ruminiclostridium sp.]
MNEIQTYTPRVEVIDDDDISIEDEFGKIEDDENVEQYIAHIPFVKWDKDKLCYQTKKSYRPVSDFLPVPVEDILYDNGIDQTRSYLIKGLKWKGGNVRILPVARIKATDAGSMNWVADNWGFSANIFSPSNANKDVLRSVMTAIGQRFAKRTTVYSHTGWRKIKGEWCYLHGNGAVGAESVKVQLENGLSGYGLPDKKYNTISLSNAVLQLFRVADESIMIPLLAVSFLSPLNEFLKQSGHEPSFILYLLGRTQSRKSTVAALALSFFGNFTASTLPASFRDTVNALERKGFILKDTLTVIDDFHPCSSFKERRSMEQKMQALSRMYGNRSGRDRMASDVELRGSMPPKGNVIVTGEDVAAIGQSGTARNFYIELQANSVPVSDYLTDTQQFAADGYYAAFMKLYIEWLTGMTDSLPSKLKEMFNEYRRKIIDEHLSGLGRTGDIVAWLMIGSTFFADFMVETHSFTEQECAGFKAMSWNILTDLARAQIEKSEEDVPTKIFTDTVHELFIGEKIYAENILQPVEFPRGEKVGYFDEQFYYFLPNKIYAEVNKACAARNEFFPLTSQRLLKQLAAENISVSSKGKNTLQKRIGSINAKFLCIPRAIIDGDNA